MKLITKFSRIEAAFKQKLRNARTRLENDLKIVMLTQQAFENAIQCFEMQSSQKSLLTYLHTYLLKLLMYLLTNLLTYLLT